MEKILDYTIPSDNRELQPSVPCFPVEINYTIPSDNRELQLPKSSMLFSFIIPYQVITGNYNTLATV